MQKIRTVELDGKVIKLQIVSTILSAVVPQLLGKRKCGGCLGWRLGWQGRSGLGGETWMKRRGGVGDGNRLPDVWKSLQVLRATIYWRRSGWRVSEKIGLKVWGRGGVNSVRGSSSKICGIWKGGGGAKGIY